MSDLLLILAGVVIAIAAMLAIRWRFGRSKGEGTVHTQTIFERVRAVGKLVGLEVFAKEIATSTKGFGWLPPLILSQARVAMIFQFEKQYYLDLTALRPEDLEETSPGRFRITLPPVEGALRLTDVTPYDIQAGRVLGLLDIVQVNAPTQKELMERAQTQAAELYNTNDARYQAEARRSIERQLTSLLELFDVSLEFLWREGEPPPARAELAVSEA